MAGYITNKRLDELYDFIKFNVETKNYFNITEKERKAGAYDIIDLLFTNLYAGCEDIVKNIVSNIPLIKKPNGKRIEDKYLIMSIEDVLFEYDYWKEFMLLKPKILEIIKGLK